MMALISEENVLLEKSGKLNKAQFSTPLVAL